MPTTRSPWLGHVGAALFVGSTMLPACAWADPRHATPAGAGPKHPAAARAARSTVRCDGAIQHPLSVRATALDPLLRGAIVRVRVTTSSRNALERGEVRLVSTGGASLVGPARVTFGRLAPGAEATTEFAVQLPAEGRRFLLQFRVIGDGQSGVAARGASLNLLPEGPVDPGRVVTSDTGERIAEYRARRIDR